jgi:hypothetical protein
MYLKSKTLTSKSVKEEITERTNIQENSTN